MRRIVDPTGDELKRLGDMGLKDRSLMLYALGQISEMAAEPRRRNVRAQLAEIGETARVAIAGAGARVE